MHGFLPGLNSQLISEFRPWPRDPKRFDRGDMYWGLGTRQSKSQKMQRMQKITVNSNQMNKQSLLVTIPQKFWQKEEIWKKNLHRHLFVYTRFQCYVHSGYLSTSFDNHLSTSSSTCWLKWANHNRCMPMFVSVTSMQMSHKFKRLCQWAVIGGFRSIRLVERYPLST